MRRACSSPTAIFPRRLPIPIGPAVSISGVASFGTLSGSPTARVNQLYEGTDSLSMQQGAHAIRVGVDFLYNDDTITFPRTIRGSYAFSSLANFLSGVYNSSGYTQTFGVTQVHQTNPNVGFYAQDEYKVTPNLTLNLGLRYDLEFLKTIATQTGNVSPRAGFAWSPFASRRTVMRGGYGLFYDRIPLRPLANALLSADNTTVVEQSAAVEHQPFATQAGAPVFPDYSRQSDDSGGRAVQLLHHEPQHEERLFRTGKLRDRAANGKERDAERRLPACARAASDHFREPERAFVHGGRHQRRLPSESDLRERQPVFFGWPIRTTMARIFRSFSGR